MATAHLEPVTIAGRSLVTGLPVSLDMKPEEIRDVLSDSANQIVATVKQTLERTPPELTADIAETGIVLAGGGSLLPGLPELITRETSIPARLCDDPLGAVARGIDRSLDMLFRFRRSSALVDKLLLAVRPSSA